MLVIPLLVLLPVYLRLPKGSPARVPLAVALAGFFVVLLATISAARSSASASGSSSSRCPTVGRSSPRASCSRWPAWRAVVAFIVAQRTGFFETILRVRTNTSSAQRRPTSALRPDRARARDTPLFGLGKNTFSAYYEFLTGEVELGAALLLRQRHHRERAGRCRAPGAFLVYVFQRLGAARRIGLALAAAGDSGAVPLRALAWGITAALAGTMAANLFYLTMQMYYFTGLIALALAVPLLLAPPRRPAAPLPARA